MKLSDLTDPGAVVAAMHEFDELGRDRFLEKYGFGRSSTYFVEYEGRRYDSKALLGAACGHQHGRPLRHEMFNGGLDTTARKLTDLGFNVVGGDPPGDFPRPPSAFVLLWNPGSWEWSQDDRDRMQQLIAEQGQAPDRWSTGSRTSGMHPGDRIFLLKVGTKPLGMIASGTARSEIEHWDHWDTERQEQAPFVDVAWDTLLCPQEVLPREVLKERSQTAAGPSKAEAYFSLPMSPTIWSFCGRPIDRSNEWPRQSRPAIPKASADTGYTSRPSGGCSCGTTQQSALSAG
ncbi:hypothetical protein [Kocuria sp. CH-021]|uniref:hypothetical protein n=1 Tax=Kocuria sp. CH-021 TaxID=3406735 RepID=UPI003C72077D